MWGWESDACDLCGAPYSLCDCHEQLKEINKDLKVIRDRLRDKFGYDRHSYVSPEFLVALRNQDSRTSLLRSLAIEIPDPVLHDSCMSGEITTTEYNDIIRWRLEAKASWLVRLWRKLWEE